jgi:hypothetical protein
MIDRAPARASAARRDDEPLALLEAVELTCRVEEELVRRLLALIYVDDPSAEPPRDGEGEAA